MSDMDDGESPAPNNRRRTESNGGSSDSELSEGWNIVDQTDVTNLDIPSSDGESVEVISHEDEARENGMTDTEVEGDSQLSPVADTPLISTTETDTPAVPEGNHQEEMFDSSFCWFLFFATAAVLVSNMAFMVAENAFAWNMDANIEAPSFLRDLPTTPKPMDRNDIVPNIPWTERDEVVVEVFDDRVTRRDAGSKYNKQSQSYEMNKKQPYKQSAERFDKHSYEKFNKQSYEKFNTQHNENNKQQSEKYNKGRNEQSYNDMKGKLLKDSLDLGDHEIGRFFMALSEVATSSETKDKLNQILLILDALYIGLNDLEEVVTENSELHDVLRKQKHKLSQVLTEMEYGVSKSLDRVASNVLNKVQKLERRFENQWCELEKRGHQEELKGLFYDCHENKGNPQSEYQTNSKYSEVIKDHVDATAKEDSNIDMNWNSYQYQVDKDSPGKEHRNLHSSEAKEVDDYYTLVKSDKHHNTEFSKDQINIKHESSSEGKDPLPSEKNHKSKYNIVDKIEVVVVDGSENRKFTDNKGKQYDNKRNHDNRGKHYEDKRKNNDSKERHFNGDGKHSDDKGKHYNDKRPRDDNGKYIDDEKGKPDDKMKHQGDEGKIYDGDGKLYNDNSKHYDDKRKHYDNKEKHHNDNGKNYDVKRKNGDNKGKNDDDKGKNYDDKGKNYDDKGKNYDDKGKNYDDKEKYSYERGYDRKGKFSDSKRNHDDRRKFSEDKRKHSNKFDTYKTYESTEHHQENQEQTHNREGQTKSEKTFVPNLELEGIGKYLKESCNKARNKFTKLSNTYEKLKNFIDSKLRVPKKMFDSLFAKYCQVNDESLKWDKRFNREHPKGDFSGKNNKNFVKDDFIITDKNVRIVEMSEVSPEDEAPDPATDNIIMSNNKPKLWVFNYDEPSYDNKSNLTGDWFFKAGESRSKMRWSHHRGDWWFERASHRRNHPQPPHWFSGRRKNWYFRRAWARQNCRHSSQDGWCDFSEEETVTVPNPEFNFR